MALLIDSNVLIGLEREGSPADRLASELGEEAIAIAAITASELLHGVHRADTALRRGRREAFVEAILEMVPVLAFDLPVARAHARLWADLRARGAQIGAHDLLIAATALAHRLPLLTRNPRHFRLVEGLEVLTR